MLLCFNDLIIIQMLSCYNTMLITVNKQIKQVKKSPINMLQY